jgi:N12 class adenine-specific DNA methylase
LYALAEKVLNGRQIRVLYEEEIVDPKDPSRMKKVTRTDIPATKVANAKAQIIKEKFKEWIFDDETRREKYEQRYNEKFNCLVGREYDGSNLTFPGMDADFTLREHQRNAIARTTMGGNALIAHVVGAGKSAVMAATVMRKKELGLINKACVVVPKSLTEQTAREWRKLYPDARLLVVKASDLSDEKKRNLFNARCATGSYDAVIISNEQFEKLPMSRLARWNYINNQLALLRDALDESKRENHGKKDWTTKNIEGEIKRYKNKLQSLGDPKSASREKDDLLEFEQLGFDYIACDEAHLYKNGFVLTKMTNVAGVTTRPAGRAEDMLMKCDYMNNTFGQGHLLMMTGTPVCTPYQQTS